MKRPSAVSVLEERKRKEEEMLNGESPTQDTVSAIIQEKDRVEQQITLLQQHLLEKDTWLKTQKPTTPGYQQVLEDWQALQAYVADLYAQVVSLDKALQDQMLACEK